MGVGILRGSRNHCIDGLAEDRFDLDSYPLRSYDERAIFRLSESEVPVIQGVNPVPQERFAVGRGEKAAEHAGLELPGILPFLVSAFQVSGRKHSGKPRPIDVGLPRVTETDFLIRWMFGGPGERSGRHTLWRRLSADELRGLSVDIRPNESIKADSRSGAAYQKISGGVAFPEPVEFISPRAGGLNHEPWLARSVELAVGWRVAVPNTSLSCLPVVVPPQLTIIGQNFNVLLCSSGRIALAIGAVLSRTDVQDYLIGICPWSKGDTPRPRSKHINTALWVYREIAIRFLESHTQERLDMFARALDEVWRLHLVATISCAKGALQDGRALRESYTAIEPRSAGSQVPVELKLLDRARLRLGTTEGDVIIDFRSQEYAALAAVAFWTAQPLNYSIAETLKLRFSADISVDAVSVKKVLFEKAWQRLNDE